MAFPGSRMKGCYSTVISRVLVFNMLDNELVANAQHENGNCLLEHTHQEDCHIPDCNSPQLTPRVKYIVA